MTEENQQETQEIQEEAPVDFVQPTKAIVTLGEAIIFKQEDRCISCTLLYRHQFKEALVDMAVPDSLEEMHVVIRSKDLEELYDPDAIQDFFPCLKAGCTFGVHVLVGENEVSGEEDVGLIRSSLILAGLKIQSETLNGDGSRTTIAIRPGGANDDDEDWDTDEDES